MTRNDTYWAEKNAKRTKQLREFEAVLGLPPRAQGGALLALWPTKIPKAVRRVMDGLVRQRWLQSKQRAQDTYHHAFANALHHMEHDPIFREAIAEQEEVEHLLDTYDVGISSLADVIFSLSHLKSIIVAVEDGVRMFDFDDQGVLVGGRHEHGQLQVALGVALHEGGGVTVRQVLPLKAQVKNEQGQMEWKHQERVFGFACAEGQWAGLPASDMRQAHNTDHETGQSLTPDPATSFGDAHNLAHDYFEKLKK